MKSFVNNGRKVHVLTTFNDNGHEVMLVKYWLSSKKRWQYNASSLAEFEMFKSAGLITKIEE